MAPVIDKTTWTPASESKTPTVNVNDARNPVSMKPKAWSILPLNIMSAFITEISSVRELIAPTELVAKYMAKNIQVNPSKIIEKM